MLGDTFIHAKNVQGLLDNRPVSDEETLYCVDPAGGQFMGRDHVYRVMNRDLAEYQQATTKPVQLRDKVKQIYQAHGPYIGAGGFSGGLYANILGVTKDNERKVLQDRRVSDEHVEEYITDMVLCDLLTMYKLPLESPLLAKYTANIRSLIPALRQTFLSDSETGSDTDLIHEHIKLLISKIVMDRSKMLDILVQVAQSNAIWCPVLPEPPAIPENLFEILANDAETPAPSAIVKWYPLSMLVVVDGTVNIDTVPTMCVIHQIGFDFRNVDPSFGPPDGALPVYERIRETIVNIIWASVIETISGLRLNAGHTIHSPVLLTGVFAGKMPTQRIAIHNIIHYTLTFLRLGAGTSIGNLPRLQLLNPFIHSEPPAQNTYDSPLEPPGAAAAAAPTAAAAAPGPVGPVPVYQFYNDTNDTWYAYSDEQNMQIHAYVTGSAKEAVIAYGLKRWSIYKGVEARRMVATGKRKKSRFGFRSDASRSPNPRLHYIIEEMSRYGSDGEDYYSVMGESQPKYDGDTYDDINIIIIQVELNKKSATGQIRLVTDTKSVMSDIEATAKEFNAANVEDARGGAVPWDPQGLEGAGTD